MEGHLLHSVITIFLILITVPASHGDDDEQYSTCSRPYECGGVKDIGYPFWGDSRPEYCGLQGFKLSCQSNEYPFFEFETQKFRLLSVTPSRQVVTIARVDLMDDLCARLSKNTNLNTTLFRYGPNVHSLILHYGCNSESTSPHSFNCRMDGIESHGFFTSESFGDVSSPDVSSCDLHIQVPVPMMYLEDLFWGRVILQEVLKKGFDVEYIIPTENCPVCQESKGICGTRSTSEDFACFCRDEPRNSTCGNIDKGGINWRVKILIGVVAGLVGILATCIAFYLCQRHRKKQNAPPFLLSRNISSDLPSVADVEKQTSCYGVSLFTYAELEEATNNFDSARELGDGGFGTVYYGKLRDGRAVAVKRLFENNCKRVEQFMNEVEILTRLRHQHLVSLYGSTSRHSRELLLVYEYVPKGTVADHLHGEHAKPGALPWPIRLKIATETASALTYLHATDIIHRDVKTNNILLDNNFSVKVADFGLSRLFPTDVTHVSTAPQGTPGYVDPEYHQCYQLTDKSDVFSFGVVLIELISSKPAVDITRHRHEINLSNMAINKIQNHALHELVDPSLGFESDSKVREMITAVAELAFQCLQNEKDMRPNMIEVLQCLTRIQSEGYNTENAEEMDVPSDDVVLLKSGPLPVSPDSVTVKWVSRSTTSDASN